jgi:hypothetical protein
MEPSSSPAADPAVAGVPLVKQQMQKTSAVRVGVRVRPFTSQEISKSRSSDSILTCITNGTQELRLGSRRFTYDAVFDESVSQETLHQSVAGPLMENFLEGYNATVRTIVGLANLGMVCLSRKLTTISFSLLDYGIRTDGFRKDLHDGKRGA